ncbi:MAG: nicotinate-nucleotide diphosphorylase (carboxylating) [Nitrospirae bacterium CG_4_10_14_0_8_um_filter_41_23]|nr:MAG: nicotinate-nucleotide diphosphorylase (carboxylating) [Nitrospirae bacterium CG2_30_41_42]PIW87298.1 MAG: nicotinate-nucleotide diphosphorylase (carboxylating) [Nitrospirae bacterium CG_4_8_14_3_um_filter_41_47]PIY86809.1 MAG: nicotinate-nucleotide diphosphorylase (carboxylating) [Nitrospirae bacterium CG_4_10_14_0_8_um_filter_41_23]
MEIPLSVIDLIHRALEEDIGPGDITTSLLIPNENKSRALYIAKENFVLAGLPFSREVFQILDPSMSFNIFYNEGAKVIKGDVVAEVLGKTRTILAGERVSLNILQRLSGIATLSSMYVDNIKGLKAKIVDTRKTTPCQRFLEKYAVRMGGGSNHRFGLFDGILIKDNHIEAVGSIKEAVKLAKGGHHLARIEVEVENLHDLNEAIEAGADIVMLDNMSVSDIKEAVKISNGRVIIEASGGIKLENVRDIAETGVDLISVGALTHSAVSVDISLKIVK